MTGEILVEEGEILSRDKAHLIAQRGVHGVIVESSEGKPVKVFGNGMVDIGDFSDYTGLTARRAGHQGKGSLRDFEGNHRVGRFGRGYEEGHP